MGFLPQLSILWSVLGYLLEFSIFCSLSIESLANGCWNVSARYYLEDEDEGEGESFNYTSENGWVARMNLKLHHTIMVGMKKLYGK